MELSNGEDDDEETAARYAECKECLEEEETIYQLEIDDKKGKIEAAHKFLKECKNSQERLYRLKELTLHNMDLPIKEIHEFKNDSYHYYALRECEGFKFHSLLLNDEYSLVENGIVSVKSEKIQGEISSENKLKDGEMTFDNAIGVINIFLEGKDMEEEYIVYERCHKNNKIDS